MFDSAVTIDNYQYYGAYLSRYMCFYGIVPEPGPPAGLFLFRSRPCDAAPGVLRVANRQMAEPFIQRYVVHADSID